MKRVKRLGIFVFYDKDGIADDYIDYLLRAMSEVLDRLVIVCNGKVAPDAVATFEKYSKDVHVRDNLGFDGGAFKDALLKYLKREEVENYNELVIFNDTFFGPFYPFSRVFHKMESSDCDFWGLSRHKQFTESGRCFSEHVQSYFVVARKRVINSDVFWNYWETFMNPKGIDDAIDQFEIEFSQTLLKAGFIMDSFLKMPEYESQDLDQNFNYPYWCCGKAISHYDFPVFKRKNLVGLDPLDEDVSRALIYIEENYDYPIEYIWKACARKLGLKDIQNSHGLNHFSTSIDSSHVKLAAFLSFTDEETLVDVCYFLGNLDNNVDIDIFVDECVANKAEAFLSDIFNIHSYEKCRNMIEYLKNNGALLSNYDYIGIFNDQKDKNRIGRLMERDYIYGQSLFSKGLFNLLESISRNNFDYAMVYPELRPKDLTDNYWLDDETVDNVNKYLALLPNETKYDKRDDTLYSGNCFWISRLFLDEALSYYQDDERGWYRFLPILADHRGALLQYYCDQSSYRSITNSYRNTLHNHLKLFEETLYFKNKNEEERDWFKADAERLNCEREELARQGYILKLAVDAAPFEYGDYHPPMKSGEELLETLIATGKSLSRFGDGEFQLMQNKERPWFQSPDELLAERLNEVFYTTKEDVLIAIPGILGDLRTYKEGDAANIRHYLQGEVREELLKIVGKERTYYDAYVTRPYLMYKDPEHGKKIFDLFKKLWDNKHVLLVEGEYMRSGVGNDLFGGVESIKRIICPSRNAFSFYDSIVETVKQNLEGIDLILCALGPTATVMAYDLADTGVQTVDLGQIDNEYEWCLMGATERVPIPGKAVPEIDGQHETDDSSNRDYLDQIICRIGC